MENAEEEIYRKQIIEMIKEIENLEILIKIYTVLKTHLKLLKQRGGN